MASSVQEESEDEYVSISSDSDAEIEKMALDLINFRSQRFSPKLALKFQGKELNVPIKDVPTYLNLHQYDKAIKDPKNAPAPLKQLKTEHVKKKTEEVANKNAESATAQQFPMPGRRFLPHQMPVYRPRKEHPNTLTIMREIKGPLSLLRKVMDEKKRIKVWTRNVDSIRGYCTGYVEAFDRHWNLALRDVDELFQRKRKIKYPAECIEKRESHQPPEEHIHREKINLDKYICKNEKKHMRSTEKLPSDKKDILQKKPMLVEGPDAIKICRLGLEAMKLNDKVTHSGGGSGTDCETRVASSASTCPDVPPSSTTNVNQKQSHPKLSDSNFPSKSQIKKRGLTVFREPYKDPYGFVVIGKSKKYEIVQRHVGQLFLMGNDVVFIEVLQ